MHRRRTHSVGADAHIGPLGTDIISTITERAIVGARISARAAVSDVPPSNA